MSKELEDLEVILHPMRNYTCEQISNAERLVKQALTPPTAEELCEELSAYMKEPVWFDDNKDIRISTQWLVKQLGKYGLNFMVVLPPYLITRIGRFYEKEGKEK